MYDDYDDDNESFLSEIEKDEKAEKARKYQKRYLEGMDAKTQNMDADRKSALFSEMENIKYNPTKHPEQDCELNILRAEKIVASKKRKLGGAASSFLRFKARADGKSAASIDRWADGVMREKD